MTKQEALELMQQGVKITHEWFSDDEWMIMWGNTITFEDGVKCSTYEFFGIRNDESWDEGYSIWEEK